MQNSTKKFKKSKIQLFNREKNLAIFDEKIEIRERCKGVHCVDLGESFPTSIFLQNLVSIQLKTSPETSKIDFRITQRFNFPMVFSPGGRASSAGLGDEHGDALRSVDHRIPGLSRLLYQGGAAR